MTTSNGFSRGLQESVMANIYLAMLSVGTVPCFEASTCETEGSQICSNRDAV